MYYKVPSWDLFCSSNISMVCPIPVGLFNVVLYADDTTSAIWHYRIHSIYRYLRYRLPVISWTLIGLRMAILEQTEQIVSQYKKDQICIYFILIKRMCPIWFLFWKINQKEIERVDKLNSPRVTLGEYVNWKAHTDKLSTRLSKYYVILNKRKMICLPIFANSLMYPSAISPQLRNTDIGILMESSEEIQNILIRIISQIKYNAHTELLLNQLEQNKLLP